MRDSAARQESGSGFRADIEGLRAVAVLLVVVYHARLGPFHGGLVGVDVFFVLSGFLITSLLLREINTTGSVSLPGFWARRARRLLPASTVVVLATVVAAHWMLSPMELRSLGHDALAAAGFVINIVFMRRSNDYFAAQSATASPLLHFWSLAVEEQFYVVWPILIALAARARRPLRWIAPGVTAIVAASFSAGLWYTNHSPIAAFYMLPMRAWELGIGALLAIAGTTPTRIPAPLRAALAWAGLAGVIVAALVVNDRTPFPGYAALLPVLATAVLVAGGGAPAPWTPTRLLSLPPLQWVGKRSYAIYLWHWPAYILATSQWGPLKNWQSATTMAAAIAIAAVSYTLIENPIRHDPWLASRARRPLALAAGLVVITSLFAVATAHQPLPTGSGIASAPSFAPRRVVESTDQTTVGPPPDTRISGNSEPSGQMGSTTAPLTSVSPTLSPYPSVESLVQANLSNIETSFQPHSLPKNITPRPASVRRDMGDAFRDWCVLHYGITDLGKRSCVYGDPKGRVKVTVVGDSHTGHWFPALEKLANKYHWRLLILAKMGCPPEEVNRFRAGKFRPDCATWRKNLTRRISDEHPDLLVVSHFRYDFGTVRGTERRGDEWEAKITAFLRTVRPMATDVVFLEDVPRPPMYIPSCLLRHSASIDKCKFSRERGANADLRAAEQRATAASGTQFAGTADWFCGREHCAVVLGNILLYADDNHLTNEAALYFEPFLESVLVRTLRGS